MKLEPKSLFFTKQTELLAEECVDPDGFVLTFEVLNMFDLYDETFFSFCPCVVPRLPPNICSQYPPFTVTFRLLLIMLQTGRLYPWDPLLTLPRPLLILGVDWASVEKTLGFGLREGKRLTFLHKYRFSAKFCFIEIFIFCPCDWSYVLSDAV